MIESFKYITGVNRKVNVLLANVGGVVFGEKAINNREVLETWLITTVVKIICCIDCSMCMHWDQCINRINTIISFIKKIYLMLLT